MDSGFGPLRPVPAGLRNGRPLLHRPSESQDRASEFDPWETAAMSSHLVVVLRSRVMRNYRPDYVPVAAILRVGEVEPRVHGAGRGVAAFRDDADGKRARTIPAHRRRAIRPRPLRTPSESAAKLEPKIDRPRRHPARKANAIATRSPRRAGKPASTWRSGGPWPSTFAPKATTRCWPRPSRA